MTPPLTADQEILREPEIVDDTALPAEEEVTDKQTPEELEEELDTLIKEIVIKAEKEDEDLRYPLLARAKRNELYFNNIQKIVYDEVAHDYRSLEDAAKEIENLAGSGDIKQNNIYRAFAESLIAALSVATPAVEFSPDDADDPDDVETAHCYSKISELVGRHNSAALMLIKALTILFNQGVVAGYNYYKNDPSFGTIKKIRNTKALEVKVADLRCAECSELLDSSVPVEQLQQQQPYECYTCGNSAPPAVFERIENQGEVTEYENTPKGRSLYDVFGFTYVKLPLYARKQEDCGYLVLRLDDHVAKFKAVYNDDTIQSGGGDVTLYERWARVPTAYSGAVPVHLTTARYAWIRPWYYWVLEDQEKIDLLLSKYPTGFMATIIGDKVVDKDHEKFDDRWTITFDPRSNFIHAEAAGNALIPMQDAENDIFNLGLQSIEYGIPETFAHPKTVNFTAYKQSAHAVGMLTPAMPPGADKSLADGFHTIKAATMSNEYTAFAQSLTQKAQFTTGAFPSIFGGAMQQGSQTATEYTESRARALQRLQLVWQMVSVFWGKLTYKSVLLFAQNLQEDEKFSKKEKGTYVNVIIEKEKLRGKAGHIEPEVNGQLPQSWAQKKDLFMSLIQMQIPEVGQILMHPNNAENLKLIAGMPDLYIPGENDRTKQYLEYYELSMGEPMGNQSSVPIDLEVDDHLVHMQVLKNILVSPIGMQLYKTNVLGYNNAIAHYKEHEMAYQAKSLEQSGKTGPGTSAESATDTSQG